MRGMHEDAIQDVKGMYSPEKWVEQWILSTYIMGERIDWMSPVTQSTHVTCTRQKQPQATTVTRRHTNTYTKRTTCALHVPQHTVLDIQRQAHRQTG